MVTTMKRFAQLRLWPDASLRIVTFKGTREDGHAMLAAAAECPLFLCQ
jgi:hypothetical protein